MFNLRPIEIACLFFLCLATLGAALRGVAVIRLRRFIRAANPPRPEGPPITLWRAVKPRVPDLAGKLAALIRGSRTGDQILIGCDPGDLAVCEKVRSQHADREITVIRCSEGRAANPKISKFIQMTPHARHPHWLLTDSEAIPTRELIDGIRSEWAASGADAMTAGYRFSGPINLAAALDTVPVISTLWPGLMLAGSVNFTLGACTAINAADLASIGGWETLADELAEDHRLGTLLMDKGRSIRLSRHILTLDADPVTLREMLRHQHRVAVTYRAASPLGALGLPILHCLPLLIIALVLGGGSHPTGAAVCAILFGVWIASVYDAARLIGAASPRLPAALIAPFIETAAWFIAWFSPVVFWSGKWRRVTWRGRFRDPACESTAPASRSMPSSGI